MNSKINGNHPEILRHALFSLIGALSSYYEDEIDVPYLRTKKIVENVNKQFNLNIDVDAIFIEPEIPDDGGCGHDYNEAYYDSELDRL